ncbi:MAG: MATE family efflux transporter [Lentisphaerae bacterium]|nr:MATE family efflux transporter [Lentisphaerota bacterium]
MLNYFIPRGRGGIGEVLKVAIPLVVASLGHALNLFTDRVMLSSYSPQAMAAAFPAGLTSFTLSCLFLGIAGYSGVFVAQYTGANEPHKASLAVWQGIFVAIIGGIFMAGTCFFAEWLFALCGHEKSLQPLEVTYFKILSQMGFIPLVTAALSCFWSGRAKNRMVMMVNLVITLFNIPLNYLLIYGNKFHFGSRQLVIPELGIAGAAWGTVSAGAIGLLIYLCAFCTKNHRKNFGTLSHFYAPEIFVKLVRFGLPTGIQLVLDLATFNIFIILLGKINETVLTASGVVFSAYSFAFNPMIGFGQTASILVGQGVGAKDIPYAEKCIRSARFLLLCYSILMIVVFVCYPELLFQIFKLPEGEVRSMTRIMLIFTVGYLIFDAANILYSNAVKGAGDTYFVMVAGILLGWLAFAIPCIAAYWWFSGEAAISYFGSDRAQTWCWWVLWSICDVYIIMLGSIFYARYKQGKWKKMSVISN